MGPDHKAYVDSIYFMSNGETGDFLGTLWKDDGGPWIFECRFRKYVDHKAFDSEDRKSAYKLTAPDDSEQHRERLRKEMSPGGGMYERLIDEYPNYHVLEMQCYNSDSKFFFELASQPWAHCKQITPEEYEEMYGKPKENDSD